MFVEHFSRSRSRSLAAVADDDEALCLPAVADVGG